MEILHELSQGAGALFIVEEALRAGLLTPLAQYVAEQPTWSDLPILILSNHGVESPGLHHVVERLGNVTLLERPVRGATLVSAARSALRGRMRQYQIREADRLKDEFLASLGHELRNPLAPIRTSMQVLNGMFPVATAVHAVTQVVERQVAHLTRLVDDLLDVARITSGKVTLQRERVALSAVVAHTVEICKPLLDAAKHRVDVSQPAGDVMLDGDPARLVQSLANVLANAIKFTQEPSTILFTVQVAGNNIIVKIKDSGIGLEGDALSRIFDMFTQSDPAHGQIFGGLGIGLGLAKRFTEMHGGSIHATSDGIGHGCEFVLTLPIVIPTERYDEQPSAEPESNQNGASKLRILVVDDNHDGANMLQMMLECDGHTVFTAYNGRQAIETAQHAKPHVVLMDIGLPDMDGYTAARNIRQQLGRDNLVIVALTGWGHDDVRQRAAEAGMQHHLVKPVDLTVLRNHLAQIAHAA
ncbi:response regulator [Herbaspirillum sp. GCM10030257]|uniref:hybrid sensor histidine kinase/response regulator n=1 Tax=Herbaspirillum sp. GCM10030257 TaxID=3273393 RepID=UPI00360EB634